MKTVRLLRVMGWLPVVLAATSVASADPLENEARVHAPAPILEAAGLAAAPPPATDRGPTTTTWYGWQTLLVDGAVLGVSLASKNPWVFLGGYTLGAPVVHWAHGNVLKGFGSLGIRVAAPLVVGALYSAAASANQNQPSTGHEGEETVSVAIVAGGIAAIVFDPVFLARSETTVAPTPARPSFLKVDPHISASRGGAYAGISGTF